VQTVCTPDFKHPFTSAAEIDLAALDWYADWRLLRINDASWANERLRLYYLLGPSNELHQLAGTSPPIHEVNKNAPIQLSRDNVLSYLVFFCFFVRGEEGPFHCIESMTDPLIAEIVSESKRYPELLPARRAIEGTMRPLTFEGMDDQGRYVCNGVIFYANAIFLAHLTVEPGGMAAMLDDEPIASDLPYRLNAPIA
jgi:hypothetical protein